MATAGPEDFLSGWMLAPDKKEVWGRPVGLLQMPDGSLLVTDDGGRKIWRVSLQKGLTVPRVPGCLKAILIHGNGGCTAADIWLPWLEREVARARRRRHQPHLSRQREGAGVGVAAVPRVA